MAANFAALEARLTACVFKHLPNASVTFFDVHGVLQTIEGIFDAAGVVANVGGFGVASSAPSLTASTASLPADPVGLALTLRGSNYVVAAAEPDGTGITRLLLESA